MTKNGQSKPTRKRGKSSKSFEPNAGTSIVRMPAWPPQIVSTLRGVRMVARLIMVQACGSASAAGLQAVTFKNLADTYQVIISAASGAGASAPLYNATVRLRRVSIWGPSTAAGGLPTSTVSIDFPGGTLGAQSHRVTDTAYGTDRGPGVTQRPPRGTMQYNWMTSSSTQVAFAFACPANSILEFEFDGTNSEENFAGSLLASAAGGNTPGATAMAWLSASPGAAATPIGFNTFL
jgi:hypothetical protein